MSLDSTVTLTSQGQRHPYKLEILDITLGNVAPLHLLISYYKPYCSEWKYTNVPNREASRMNQNKIEREHNRWNLAPPVAEECP